MFWLLFHLILAVLLIVDLRHEAKSWKHTLLWSGIWVGVALAWNLVIYCTKGPALGLEFLTAYLLEKSLSIDNLCIFFLIFSSFQVPHPYQKKVLLCGILGAIFLRLILILAGLQLMEVFHPITYVFGAIIIYSGMRFLFHSSKEPNMQNHQLLRWIRRYIPITHHFGEGCFRVEEEGKKVWTRLAAVLVLMEGSDLIFAFDSIPAVLAITQDRLVAYTSNVCAILGLRSLYFVLMPWIQHLDKAKWGLGMILLFVGGKMIFSSIWTIPTSLSLLIIALFLAIALIPIIKKG